jgi:hypothetical protein
LTPTIGVEWSSWKMTRIPFGRKNCVYLIGGRTGAPFAADAAALAPPLALALPFCASAVVAGANKNAASVTNARRFQNIITPPRVFEGDRVARPRGPSGGDPPAPSFAL